MRRYLTLIAPLFVVVLAAAPAAAKTDKPKNPHHEQQDGCDHGNTGKPCKDDPQPDKGKDCEEHGNHGGINEDHCATTTTTEPPSEPTTTTTTLPSTPTTTTTTSPDTTDTTTVTAPTTTTTAPAEVTPNLGCVTPDGHPYVTNIEQGGCASPIPTDSVPPTAVETTAPASQTELPRTGWDAGLLFVIGTALIMAGLSCWFAGKAVE